MNRGSTTVQPQVDATVPFDITSDNCSGVMLAPKASCQVMVNFHAIDRSLKSKVAKITGLVTARDNLGGFHSGNLIGIATGPATPPATAGFYIANSDPSSPSIIHFAQGVKDGDTSPDTTIAGNATGLGSPLGVALDPSQNIYIAGGDVISIFPKDSNGDVSPGVTISGDNTGLQFLDAIALDAESRIYVADRATNVVAVFAPGASGNVAPIATISGSNTGLDFIVGIAVDSTGVYVTNCGQVCGGANGDGSHITVYSPLGTSTGNLNEAPIATISGANADLQIPTALALDSRKNLYVTNVYSDGTGRGSVNEYSAADLTNGGGNITPIATIVGKFSELSEPFGIKLDNSDNIYVTNQIGPIAIYKAGSNGDVSPMVAIVGAHTPLHYPVGIVLSP